MKRLSLAAALLLVTTSAPSLAQTRSISASDKAQGAQANPELLKQFGGAYQGPQSAYVERVGRKVAVQSGLSNAGADFTVALLNSPVENAFAIPGGYIYVTRQLLALMNSEAELASVMGHEVGHVAARHSDARAKRSAFGSIFAGVVGAVAGNGMIGNLLGAASRTGAQLYTLKYGRDQEYQADGLGVRYITAAGYDPYAAASMLTQLNTETTLQSRIAGRNANAVPAWASTHPNGADRIARARALAQATGRAPAPGAQDVAFLRMLDGLAYDDDPAEGVIDGQTFRHKALRVRFAAPAGYTIDNGADVVTVSGNGGQAQFRVAASSSDLAGFTATQMQALGISSANEPQAGIANGVRYVAQTGRAMASNRQVDATIVAYAFPSATYWFVLVTPAGQGAGPFGSLVSSVAPLSVSEAAAIRGKRIAIVTVKAGDTIDTLAARMAYTSFQRDRFVALNGLAANARLAPGTLVKVVVAG